MLITLGAYRVKCSNFFPALIKELCATLKNQLTMPTLLAPEY